MWAFSYFLVLLVLIVFRRVEAAITTAFDFKALAFDATNKLLKI